MTLGVSSSCFYPLLTEKSVELLGKNNVRNIEIFFNANCELEKPFVAQLKSICNFYGMKVLSIHPTMSLAESFMLFSAYDRRKEEGLENFKRYGEICSELGAEYIILHGGKPNGVLSDSQYFERFSEISDCAFFEGGTLLQENVAKFRAGNLDFLKLMSESLGDKAKFCLDIKQCIRGGYSPFDALLALKDKIKHIHISDSSSEKDCLLPFNGNFDFKKLFESAKEIGFGGAAILEVYNHSYTEYSEIFDSFSLLKRQFSNIID